MADNVSGAVDTARTLRWQAWHAWERQKALQLSRDYDEKHAMGCGHEPFSPSMHALLDELDELDAKGLIGNKWSWITGNDEVDGSG